MSENWTQTLWCSSVVPLFTCTQTHFIWDHPFDHSWVWSCYWKAVPCSLGRCAAGHFLKPFYSLTSRPLVCLFSIVVMQVIITVLLNSEIYWGSRVIAALLECLSCYCFSTVAAVYSPVQMCACVFRRECVNTTHVQTSLPLLHHVSSGVKFCSPKALPFQVEVVKLPSCLSHSQQT